MSILHSWGVRLPFLKNRMFTPLLNRKKKKSDVFDIAIWCIAYNLAFALLNWVFILRNGSGLCRLLLVVSYFCFSVLIPLAVPHFKIISDIIMFMNLNLLS